jgi:hypothetical protein
MHTAQSILSMQKSRIVVLGLLVFTGATSLLVGQVEVKKQRPTPAKIDAHFVLLIDSVVQQQWAHTLKLVNAPESITLLNPGQCIRVGLMATGDDRDSYLEKTKLSFRVQFSGQNQEHPLAPLAQIKQIKPEGGDFVTQALAAADIKNPVPTMASLGASADNWCVPTDAQDGSAVIEGEIETPSGHQKQKSAKIQIESFETGSKRSFKDTEAVSNFLMHYHWQPNPARLFPALQAIAADKRMRDNQGNLASTAATFGAALKANPAAAKDFMARVSTETGFTRAYGLLILLQAGDDIGSILKTMSEEDRQKFTKHPVFPDPYDFNQLEDIGVRQDMLWGMFITTGDFAPLQQIASALKWRTDWDDFDKARKSTNPPKQWTPAIGRAVGYGAAGWSVGSFQRTDPLAADYIEFMIASPDTPPSVKSELTGLSTNPAFKREDKK